MASFAPLALGWLWLQEAIVAILAAINDVETLGGGVVEGKEVVAQ